MASCAVRSDTVVCAASQKHAKKKIGLHGRIDYLGRFQFTLLCAELATPRGFCIGVLLDTGLEFVQLPPPLVQ
jgi:hypothetical protein